MLYKQRGSQTSAHAADNGTVYEHVLIVEQALGKPIPKGAQVHHVDGNKANNQRGNLVLCQDIAYHKLLHARMRVRDAGGNPNTQKICSFCRVLHDLSAFNKMKSCKGHGLQSACRTSMANYRKAHLR